MNDELKPCPFCGGMPTLESHLADMEEPGWAFVHCPCGGEAEMSDYESQAIEGWNTRPIEDALRAELAQARARNKLLEKICDVANQTYSCVDEWWGQASTKQAARDSMWRLGNALRHAGFVTDYQDNLDWRGAILKELNDAGFYPSVDDPYHATAPDFVYDPTAPDNKRIFGNAIGPTITQIVNDLAAARARIEQLEQERRPTNRQLEDQGFSDGVTHWNTVTLPEPPEGEGA